MIFTHAFYKRSDDLNECCLFYYFLFLELAFVLRCSWVCAYSLRRPSHPKMGGGGVLMSWMAVVA